MFRLTPEDAFRLFTEWLSENEPEIAERGMEVSLSKSLFSEIWPCWPTEARF